MNFSLIVKLILFITLITDGVLLFFILFKKNKRLIHYLLLFGVLGILGWTISVYFVLLTSNFFVAKLTFFFALFFTFSLYWLTVIFPSGNFPRINLKTLTLCIFTFFVFIVLFFDDALFRNIGIVDDYYIKVDTGNFSIFYTILTAFYILSPIVILIKKRKNNDYSLIVKDQIKFLLIGYSLFALIIWFSNYILPVYFEVYFFNGIGPSFSMIFIGFVLFIIGRYSFLDIKLIVQRGIVYSILFSIIIGIYLVLMFLLSFFFQKNTDLTMLASALITTMVCVYTIPIIEKYFKKWTDKIFFKDKYDYSEAIFSLSEILNKNIDLDRLLKESAGKLKNILKIKNLMIILPKQNILLDAKGVLSVKSFSFIKDSIKAIEDDDISYLNHSEIINLLKGVDKKSEKYNALKMAEIYGKKFNISVTVPIKLENKLIGLLMLGEKLSGDIYTNEDYNLLKTFSIQAGVALEKARLYEKVKNHSKDLEKKVKARVSEIKELQEEQKQMMLEISHGLQTPLTIIKGELHNLESQVKDKKNIKYLEKNLDRISMFIYDMLRLAKMENQKDGFEKEKFDLSELFFDLIENFKIITQERNISLKSDIEKNVFFNGSKKEIEELIMNIVSNSVKYFGSKKNKEIKFVLKRKGSIIKLTIEDNGIGIKKDKIAKLFSRFYRAGKDNRGTGLGLAICKEIVNRHLGDIKVESEEGVGAKFIISLPLIKNKNKKI